MQTSQSAQSPWDSAPKKGFLAAVCRRTLFARCCECRFVLLLSGATVLFWLLNILGQLKGIKVYDQ